MTYHIIGYALGLVESRSAVPARTRRWFEARKSSSWGRMFFLESRLAIRI